MKNFLRKTFRLSPSKINSNKKTILFVVENIEGWTNLSSVYTNLILEEQFNVLVIICPIKDQRQNSVHERYQKIVDFLTEKNIQYIDGFNNNKYINLLKFSPDLIFFHHPYDSLRSFKYNSYVISKCTKIAYITYGFMLSKSDNLHYKNDFFSNCRKIYVESEYYINNFCKYYYKNWVKKVCVASGQPKLDLYLNQFDEPVTYWPRSKNDSIKRVIIAPHWTIKWGTDEGTLVDGYCHFHHFKEAYLELPNKYPNIDFVLRPHPLMANELVTRELYTQEQLNEFEEKFLSYKNTKIDKSTFNYFDAFMSSDGLITDGVSFLGEYLPSKKPILHTLSDNYIGFNDFGEELIKNYYKAKKADELFEFIEKVILEGNDYLYKDRMSDMNRLLFLPDGGSGKFIAQDIKKLLLK